VRRDLGAAAQVLIPATLALAVVAVVVPGRLGLAARIYALVVCGTALLAALRALRRSYPPTSSLRRGVRGSTRGRRAPASLARLEDETALGVAGAFDLHHRLRPRLRAIAAGVLETRAHVSLDGDPLRAREVLGNETWSLLRADHPPPEDRLARGLPVDELRRVVESLEEVRA
jgi:hypothetical protein